MQHRAPWCYVALLTVTLAGCATTKPKLVMVDTWAYRADSGIVAAETVLAHAGQMPPARSREILGIAQPVAQLGLQITRVLRAWQPEQPIPDQLPELVARLYDLVVTLIALLPDEPGRALRDAPMVQARGDLDAQLEQLEDDWQRLLAQIARRLEEIGG